MKIIRILLPLLAVLFLSACTGGKVSEIEVTSARIVSIVPQGLTTATAELEVGVHNPAARITLKDLSGLAKYKGEPLLDFDADALVIEGKTDSVYCFPVRCRLSEGFSILRLLNAFDGNADENDLTFSVKGRAALKGGLGKDIELEDVPLGTLLDKME